MATLTVASVIIRPFAGLVLDTRDRRKLILLFEIVLFLIPSALYIFLVPFWALLILRFVQGLGWGITHTTMATVATDIVPSLRLAEGMGTFYVTGSMASALAPLMCLWLSKGFRLVRCLSS